MPRTPLELTDREVDFLTERHLGTLTTIRDDGFPHVVAIAFAYDPGQKLVRIITSEGTQKVRNVDRSPTAVVSQVDGRRWLSLEGEARVNRDPAAIGEAVSAFEVRYRPARENPARVAIEIEVKRVLGRA